MIFALSLKPYNLNEDGVNILALPSIALETRQCNLNSCVILRTKLVSDWHSVYGFSFILAGAREDEINLS